MSSPFNPALNTSQYIEHPSTTVCRPYIHFLTTHTDPLKKHQPLRPRPPNSQPPLRSPPKRRPRHQITHHLLPRTTRPKLQPATLPRQYDDHSLQQRMAEQQSPPQAPA